MLIAFSVFLAFFLRFEGNIPDFYIQTTLPWMIGLSLVFVIPLFFYFRLYSLSWAYVSTGEVVLIGRAVTIAFLVLGTMSFILRETPVFAAFPRSVLVMSYVLVFGTTGILRLSKRIYLQLWSQVPSGSGENVLIVGAGDAGTQIARSIMDSRRSYRLVGFADDDYYKVGSMIYGVQVLGKINDIPDLIMSYHVSSLIIALPSAGSEPIKRATELGRQAGLKHIKILPPLSEIITGEVSVRDAREVDIEDLLGRDPLSLDTNSLERFLRDKTVLVTGGAGSIGSELVRQVAKFQPKELLLLDQDETGVFHISKELEGKFPNLKIYSFVADIVDKEKIFHIFEQFRPQIVFHAAAYKHVPLMEEQPEEAVKNNLLGTKVVAEAAIGFGCEEFVFISTDKAVNPTSVMGATKRAGEMLCQILNQEQKTKFISVRFGNVLNSRGSVIPIFRSQIAKGGPVEVTHPDMKRYFMLISEACLLVMQASAMGKGGEVFVLDMGKPMQILDLAREMIRLSGFEPDKDIPIVFTGVRPGEKFFEDILSAEEGTLATQHSKIFQAQLTSVQGTEFGASMERLIQGIRSHKKEEIVELLRSLVPTFTPGYNGKA